MARGIAAETSFVGSYSSVYRGRAWSKPVRQIELTLGEATRWNGREGKYEHGDVFEFTFESIEDARLIANAILREVKVAKAAGK